MLAWVIALLSAFLVGVLVGRLWPWPSIPRAIDVEFIAKRAPDTPAHVACRLESADGVLVAEKRFRRETLRPTLLWRGQWYTACPSEINGTRVYRAMKEPHGHHVQ
jgi:hypothetical protein